MSYEKKISRANPGLIVEVIDDSGSMSDNLPSTTDAKYKWVERYTGIILKELLARSTEIKGDGTVIKPRYYTHTILYGSSPEVWGKEGMDIQATVEQYTNSGNSLGLGGQLGGIDAAAAFQMALDFLKKAVNEERFRDSFSPMVFHLTDGMSHTDAQPVVNQIKQLSTSDGNVLVVNAFIGTQTSLSYKGPDDFPGYVDAKEASPSEDNIRMFNMSSAIPECICQNLVDDGIFPDLQRGAVCFSTSARRRCSSTSFRS